MSDDQIGPAELEISSELGEGPLGKVYQGVCRGNAVAIKKIQESAVKVEYFLKEIEFIRNEVRTPHVALTLGACLDLKGSLLVVTELLSTSVDAQMRDSSHPLPKRIDWVSQAARGVAWLHQLSPPILHLNLKPSNMIMEQNHVKLCDFSLAEDPRNSKVKIYQSPEFGGGKKPSTKSDVYSFAVALWEIIWWNYREGDVDSIFIKKLSLDKSRLPLSPAWPQSITSLISSMWKQSESDRPPFVGSNSIGSTLEGIQKEQEEAYFIQQLQQAIRNPEGITFWKEHFSNVKIDWMQFAIPFFQSVRVFFPDPSLEQNERRIDSPYFAHQRGKSRMNLADLRKKSKEELQQDECMVACLQELLMEKKEEVVDASKFGDLLAFVGPLDPHLPSRVKYLLKEDYFHGYLSSQEAETLLRQKPSGTFLVRFSSKRWQAAISFVDRKGVVKHLVVHNEKVKGYRWKKTQDKFWPTIVSFIDAHRERFFWQHACGGSPFSHFFRESEFSEIDGYQDETEFNESEYD